MKKFNNKIAVRGSKSLLHAFIEELNIIGGYSNVGIFNYETIGQNHTLLLNASDSNTYMWANHKGSVTSDMRFVLPQDWDIALEKASELENEVKFEVGDWVICLPNFRNDGNNVTDMNYGGAGYNSNMVFKINNITNTLERPILWYEGSREGVYSDSCRKATPQEIETHLISIIEKELITF